jgi:hypothetical protein
VHLPGFTRVSPPPTPTTHPNPNNLAPSKKTIEKNPKTKKTKKKTREKRDLLLDALIPEQFEFLQ